jgi:hypothetical protein
MPPGCAAETLLTPSRWSQVKRAGFLPRSVAHSDSRLQSPRPLVPADPPEDRRIRQFRFHVKPTDLQIGLSTKISVALVRATPVPGCRRFLRSASQGRQWCALLRTSVAVSAYQRPQCHRRQSQPQQPDPTVGKKPVLEPYWTVHRPWPTPRRTPRARPGPCCPSSPPASPRVGTAAAPTGQDGPTAPLLAQSPHRTQRPHSPRPDPEAPRHWPGSARRQLRSRTSSAAAAARAGSRASLVVRARGPPRVAPPPSPGHRRDCRRRTPGRSVHS